MQVSKVGKTLGNPHSEPKTTLRIAMNVSSPAMSPWMAVWVQNVLTQKETQLRVWGERVLEGRERGLNAFPQIYWNF